MIKVKNLMILTLGILWIVSCGQDPSFINLKKDKSSDSTSSMDSNNTATAQHDEDATKNINLEEQAGKILGMNNGGVLNANIGGTNNNTGSSDAGGGYAGNNPSDPDYINVDDPDQFTIPGSDDAEISGVRKCLQKWGKVPFEYNIQNVRRIHAAVNVGNYGYPINDTNVTPYPELVIIYAGVNVNSNVVYRMLNPNGWYCMLVNVNVNSTLKIDLHCNARLADNKVNVNVGSNVSDTTAAIGINVNSNVSINTIRTQGTECVR